MSYALGVQLSVTQVVAGVLIGAGVEALLPRKTEGASLTNQVFEALVQVGLNGFALAGFAGLIRGEGVDPTFGIPFSTAMYAAQPELRMRLELLSGVVQRQVALASQRMVPPVAAA
jgi:hypothetical protein